MSFAELQTYAIDPLSGKVIVTSTTGDAASSNALREYQEKLLAQRRAATASELGAVDRNGNPLNTNASTASAPSTTPKSRLRRAKEYLLGKPAAPESTAPPDLSTQVDTASVSFPRAEAYGEKQFAKGVDAALRRLSESGVLDALTSDPGGGNLLGSMFSSATPQTASQTAFTGPQSTATAPSTGASSYAPVYPRAQTSQALQPYSSGGGSSIPPTGSVASRSTGGSMPGGDGTAVFKQTTNKHGEDCYEIEFRVPPLGPEPSTVFYQYGKDQKYVLAVTMAGTNKPYNEINIGGLTTGATSAGGVSAFGDRTGTYSTQARSTGFTPRSQPLTNNPVTEMWNNVIAKNQDPLELTLALLRQGESMRPGYGPQLCATMGGALTNPDYIHDRQRWMDASKRPILDRYDWDNRRDQTHETLGLITKEEAFRGLCALSMNLADMGETQGRIADTLDQAASHLGLTPLDDTARSARWAQSQGSNMFSGSGFRSGVSNTNDIEEQGERAARKMITDYYNTLTQAEKDKFATDDYDFRKGTVKDWAHCVTDTTRKTWYTDAEQLGSQWRENTLETLVSDMRSTRNVPPTTDRAGTEKFTSLCGKAVDTMTLNTTGCTQTEIDNRRGQALTTLGEDLDKAGWKSKTATGQSTSGWFSGGIGSALSTLGSYAARNPDTTRRVIDTIMTLTR